MSRARAIVAAVAAAVAVSTAAPAHALTTRVYVFQGAGTISPGVGITPTAHSVTFSGYETELGTIPVLGLPFPCEFSGTEIGDIAEAVGAISGSCGPATYTDVIYVRTGVELTAVAVGSTSVATHFDCVFRPLDTLPTTLYTLFCAVALDVH